MKSTLVYIVYLIFFNQGFSQTPQGFDLQQNLKSMGGETSVFGANTIRPIRPQYQGFVGTPYLSEKPLNGTLILNGNKEFNGYFNFDWIENAPLIFKNESSSYMIIDDKLVKQLSLHPEYDSLIILDKIRSLDDKYFFGQLIGQVDSIRIYMVVFKTVKKANFSGAYNAGKPYDEIISTNNYFTCNSMLEQCTPFRPTKKSFNNLFPLYSDKISKNSFLIKPSKPELISNFLIQVKQ